MIKILYTQRWNRIRKPVKTVLKVGEGKRKSNTEGEFQSSLYTCMEISQCNAFIQWYIPMIYHINFKMEICFQISQHTQYENEQCHQCEPRRNQVIQTGFASFAFFTQGYSHHRTSFNLYSLREVLWAILVVGCQTTNLHNDYLLVQVVFLPPSTRGQGQAWQIPLLSLSTG
jgi:hypothetical protein